jgi:hypothetical protein
MPAFVLSLSARKDRTTSRKNETIRNLENYVLFLSYMHVRPQPRTAMRMYTTSIPPFLIAKQGLILVCVQSFKTQALQN